MTVINELSKNQHGYSEWKHTALVSCRVCPSRFLVFARGTILQRLDVPPTRFMAMVTPSMPHIHLEMLYAAQEGCRVDLFLRF